MLPTRDDGPAEDARGMTRWRRREVPAPIRAFLSTESGSSVVLVVAIAAALAWANIDAGSYERAWHARFAIELAGWHVDHPLRTWVNSGLMTFFFLVAGLEARREVDLGELRDRRRFVLPVAAGLAGMAVPAGLYLLINRHSGDAHGWGVAMSTDTALSLGLLAVTGRLVPARARAFLVTVFVVDDIAALIVIAFAYSESVHAEPLLLALAVFVVLLAAMRLHINHPALYLLLGVAMWLALDASGVDPIVTGLAIGITASAYSPARSRLEQASVLFRRFREQPTAEVAREAATGLTATLSPNARLQRVYHPWSSFVIVPLFGLANAGIPLHAAFLRHAATAPVTVGVFVGYVVGKPVAVLAVSGIVTWLSRGRIRPVVGWAAVAGSGTIAGVGFTVSFLIAALAFHGQDLAEAKLGVLAAAAVAALLTTTIFRSVALLPEQRRARLLQGSAEALIDLALEVDERADHVRGSETASVTIVEYGDFQCPYCGQAEPAVRRELAADEDIRFVWRHLPLTDVHPQAQQAAEAAEAAAAQGRFWDMHDAMLAAQEELRLPDLVATAERLGLDAERFRDELVGHVHGARVARDLDSADLGNVAGTPTFFVNGQRYYGVFDVESLTEAVRTARQRVWAARVDV